jgi:hypothetical protein
MEVKELKAEYATLAKKYKLPSFIELNENFEIEKIDRESETLLRAVRKVVIEKIVNSLGFVEMLLNPINVPRLYVPFIKSMAQEQKILLDQVYWKFSELSTGSLACEIHYDENKEAELIRKTNTTWNEIKKDFGKLLENISKPKTQIEKKEKSYFG